MKLCYVEGNFAWFATGYVDGHLWHRPRNQSAPPDADKATRVFFESSLTLAPEAIPANEINRGACAWLYGKEIIHGGVSIEEFERIIIKSGGCVMRQIKVKPLNWCLSNDGGRYADTPLGKFTIDHTFVVSGPGCTLGPFGSLFEARDAAWDCFSEAVKGCLA